MTLEHRFYGDSLPAGPNFTVANLRLLTVEQALADLARFITHYARGRKVVTFGCSYAGAMARVSCLFYPAHRAPGAMSAWFRVRYPNVTVGSISSSGVVNPIRDFSAFDVQVTKSLASVAPACLEQLLHAYSEIDVALRINAAATMKRFNASGFVELDFLYFMADAAAETVQYGYQATLCKYMVGGTGTAMERYARFIMGELGFFPPSPSASSSLTRSQNCECRLDA